MRTVNQLLDEFKSCGDDETLKLEWAQKVSRQEQDALLKEYKKAEKVILEFWGKFQEKIPYITDAFLKFRDAALKAFQNIEPWQEYIESQDNENL